MVLQSHSGWSLSPMVTTYTESQSTQCLSQQTLLACTVAMMRNSTNHLHHNAATSSSGQGVGSKCNKPPPCFNVCANNRGQSPQPNMAVTELHSVYAGEGSGSPVLHPGQWQPLLPPARLAVALGYGNYGSSGMLTSKCQDHA